MKTAAPTPHIEIDALRVGMFVHLDVGWMSHPFPLSSFRIGSPDQLATIRSLGLRRVRWSPEQSTPDPAALAAEEAAAAHAAADVAEPEPIESPEAVEARRRGEALADQRAALQVCERQFSEAARECRQITDLVASRPATAAEGAQALSRALLDKMSGERDLCIRLLTEGAGDKASAHAINVTVISLLMARACGLAAEDMQDLGVGALLHDIGKLDLPERVRHLDDHLSPSEMRYYEDHVARGVAQGRRMHLSPGALLAIAQHHELADGSGFPLRLHTDRMSAGARILALVNRYDNLCNPHVPSKALTPHEALSLLFAQGKNKFDTTILGAFIKMMGVYPPGSTVQLTDDRFALVVGVNSSRPLKPRVLVHDAGQRADDALIVDLEQQPNLGIRRSVKPLALPREALDFLSPRPRVAYFFEPARVLEAVA